MIYLFSRSKKSRANFASVEEACKVGLMRLFVDQYVERWQSTRQQPEVLPGAVPRETAWSHSSLLLMYRGK